MKQKTLIYIAIVTILSMVSRAYSSEYQHDGKTITRGQAIMILAENPQAKVTKVDRMTLDRSKGTLRILKQVKK